MDQDQQFKLLSKVVDHYKELKYSLLAAQTFNPEHYGFPAIYYKIMETDKVRVAAFKDAFERFDNFKDAVVCEAGVGTLALTQHYLPHVKKAYLIENNPRLKEFLTKEIEARGWADRVELIFGDAMQAELPEPVDFVIGELMSIYCANEYQVQIFKQLRQFLKPGGRLIPDRIINLAQLGYAHFEEGHKHYPILFTRHWPSLISSQEIVNTIDLYKEETLAIERNIRLKALLSGPVNCVLMSSWVQCSEGINFTGTDSLMPPTVVRLAEERLVEAGEELSLRLSFTYGTSLDEAAFEVR